MKYNYTIVIPHHNNPELLEKCLDSIPVREDVAIIVVDDNSNPDLVDFDHFPGVGRKNTKVIFDKSGKGAGNARNIGLTNIEQTKWLLFADSDDYFTPYLSEAMDKYVDSDADQIYFKRLSVYVGTNEPAPRHQGANERIDYVYKSRDYDRILFKDLAPVCKFVNYDIVKNNHISFEPIRYSNDAMFFLLVSCNTSKVLIDTNPIYVVTESKNSLMYTYNREAIECRYYAATRIAKVQRKVGKDKYHPNLFAYCYKFAKINRFLPVMYFFKSLWYTSPKYIIKDISACVRAAIKKDYRN